MPTLVLATGFEHGVNNTTSLVKGNAGNKFADTLNNSPTITSSTPRTGGFCLEISAAAAAEHVGWGTDTLGSAASVMVVGYGLYFPSAIPTADVVVQRIITSSATIDFEMSFRNSDDKLILNTSTGSGTAAVSTNAVVADTWYWIDLRLTMSGTAWQADWAIDTVAQTQFNHTAPSTDTSSAVDLGTRTAGATLTARYDDLVISKTSGDYPLGKHSVKRLTADTGGTTAEIGGANGTSRFVTNSTADATHNSAQILTALTDGPPPTFGATASGVTQRSSGTGIAVGIPMTTYTLGTGETFSGLRIEIPGWAATATTNNFGLRTYNGTTETILFAAADPNFDADTAAPAWLCKMATASEFDTQTEVDALVVRLGYSGDINPLPGAHAVYAALAVKESGSQAITPGATTVTASGTVVLGMNVIPGAVTASVTPGTAVITQPQPITPAALTVTASGTVSLGMNVVPAPVTVTGTGTVVVTPPPQAVTPGAVTVTATAGTLVVTQPAGGITPNALTVSATGTVTLGMNVTPGAVTATVTPGSVSLALNVTPGATTGDITAGSVVVTQTAGAADAYQAPIMLPGFFINPDAASVQLWGERFSSPNLGLTGAAVAVDAGTLGVANFLQGIIPGVLTVTASAGSLTVAVEQQITPGAVTTTATPSSLEVILAQSVDLTGPTVTASGTVVVTTGPVGVTPAAVTTTATPGSVVLTQPVQAVTPSPTSVSVTPNTVTLALAIIPGAVTVNASAGALSIAVGVALTGTHGTVTAGSVVITGGAQLYFIEGGVYSPHGTVPGSASPRRTLQVIGSAG